MIHERERNEGEQKRGVCVCVVVGNIFDSLCVGGRGWFFIYCSCIFFFFFVCFFEKLFGVV